MMRPITIKQMSEELDVSQHTVLRGIKLGEVQVSRLGPWYLINEAELERVKKVGLSKGKVGRPTWQESLRRLREQDKHDKRRPSRDRPKCPTCGRPL